MFPGICCHLWIKDIGKYLGCEIDHRYTDTLFFQVVGSLQANKSCSDHYRSSDLIFFYVSANTFCVIGCTHRKYSLQISAFDRQLGRRRSCRDHQSVIGTGFYIPCVCIPDCHFVFSRIQRHSLFSPHGR